MRIAVTGASGHVGANLVRALLERGDYVIACVHRDERALDGMEVERRPFDLADPRSVTEAFRGAEAVFHLAATISIRGGRLDEARLLATNVQGVHNVLAACREQGVGRLVHFSSIHALMGDDPDRVVDETAPLALGPDCACYDRSKAMGEQAVLDAVARGLDAVIITPTSIIGPNDYGPSAQGAALLAMAKSPWLPSVRAGYDWVDARDVVKGAILALEKGKRGERYILGHGRLTFLEIGEHIRRATGRRATRLALPIWLVRCGVPFAGLYSRATGRRQLLTGESLSILGRHLAVSSDKARRELGYAPRPFEETFRDTFDWFEAAGMLPRRGR